MLDNLELEAVYKELKVKYTAEVERSSNM